MIEIGAVVCLSSRETGISDTTHDCILILPVYISSNDTHRSKNVQRLHKTNAGALHSLASRNPDFQTFGVVEELSEELEELGYMRLERIHYLLQDGIEDENTNLALSGIWRGHGGMEERQ